MSTYFKTCGKVVKKKCLIFGLEATGENCQKKLTATEGNSQTEKQWFKVAVENCQIIFCNYFYNNILPWVGCTL